MHVIQNHPRLAIAGAIVVVLTLFVGGYALYLGNAAGALPWQEDPTRIPITPFAGIPWFGGSGPTATPSP